MVTSNNLVVETIYFTVRGGGDKSGVDSVSVGGVTITFEQTNNVLLAHNVSFNVAEFREENSFWWQ